MTDQCLPDANGHGVLRSEISNGRRRRLRSRRRIRPLHVIGTDSSTSLIGLQLTNLLQMAYDTPLTPQGQALTTLPVREQLRRGLKDMGSRSYSSAKNFAMIGAMYSGTECCIEGLRAKNDLTNSVLAGCVTGGALAYKAGPQAAVLGCGGFAAFSAAIDAYMRMPGD